MPDKREPLSTLTRANRKILLDKRTRALLEMKVDPLRLEKSRKEARAFIESVKKKAESKRDPKTAKKLSVYEKRRYEAVQRLDSQVKAMHKRTPDSVIQDFSRRLNLAKVRAKFEKRIKTPASLIVRLKTDNRQKFILLFAKCFGVSTLAELEKIGVASITRMSVSKSSLSSYSVHFKIERKSVRTEIMNLAWALRKLQLFDSVSVGGLKVSMNAVEPGHAQRAERNYSWHLDLTRVTQAHALNPRPGGQAQGGGIVIAHPDSGWASHSQFNRNQIDVDRSHNVLTGRTGGNAAMHSIRNEDQGLSHLHIDHGTSTGSLIIGGVANDGTPTQSSLENGELDLHSGEEVSDSSGHITGVAPRATLLPIKFIDDDIRFLDTSFGVLRIADEDLVAAIRYAIVARADVISLSIGGLVHDEVRQILDEAILEHDMIVVAAAGQTTAANLLSKASDVAAGGYFDRITNTVSFVIPPDRRSSLADDSVTLPAAFSNVIGVAGCIPTGEPWDASHRGPNIDITAPANAIWKAGFSSTDDTRSDNTPRAELVDVSEGTSYSAAFMAGVAALWLSHWGRDSLIARYRASDIPLAWVFYHQLQLTATAAHVGDWNTRQYGPGVINAEALLALDLPDAGSVLPPPEMVTGLIHTVNSEAVRAGVEIIDFIQDLPDHAGALAVALYTGARRQINEGLNQLEEQLAQLNALGDEWLNDASTAIDAVKQAIGDTVEAGEEAVEEFIDDAEEVWDNVEEKVEDVIDDVGEAAESLWGWIRGG